MSYTSVHGGQTDGRLVNVKTLYWWSMHDRVATSITGQLLLQPTSASSRIADFFAVMHSCKTPHSRNHAQRAIPCQNDVDFTPLAVVYAQSSLSYAPSLAFTWLHRLLTLAHYFSLTSSVQFESETPNARIICAAEFVFAVQRISWYLLIFNRVQWYCSHLSSLFDLRGFIIIGRHHFINRIS